MENQKVKLSTSIIYEAILILIFTAGIYWLSFLYESSYLAVYQIPVQLIDISINLLLSTFIKIFYPLLFLFFAWNLILMNTPKNPIIRNKVFRISLELVGLIWYVLAYGFRIKDLYLYLIAAGIVIFLELIWPLIFFSNHKTLISKIIADEISQVDERSKSIFSKILDIFGPFYYFIFLFLLFASLSIGVSGAAEAKNKVNYPVDVNDSTIAVIRMYASKFICIKYDPVDKKIKSYFVSEPYNNEYENKNIGPLNFDK